LSVRLDEALERSFGRFGREGVCRAVFREPIGNLSTHGVVLDESDWWRVRPRGALGGKLRDAFDVVINNAKSAGETIRGPLGVGIGTQGHVVPQKLEWQNHGCDFREPRVVVLDACEARLELDAGGGGSWKAHNQWRRLRAKTRRRKNWK
jgi:hypothetical protein